jgi:hypothetical protein
MVLRNSHVPVSRKELLNAKHIEFDHDFEYENTKKNPFGFSLDARQNKYDIQQY